MEALFERRRIVREQLTDVVGKVEDLLLVEQPPMSELTHLSKTLTEQNDSLTLINREVENTVDIANLEAEMWDAFQFEARVIRAKVQLEMMLTDTANN